MSNNNPKQNSQEKKFRGFLKLKCQIIVRTGLHIGGSKESIEIGGVDNIVIKTPFYKVGDREFQNVPYIPGSSIKGKIRALLEWVEKPSYPQNQEKPIALANNGEPCSCGKCNVCKLFGAHKAKGSSEPVRLMVEDFFPTQATLDMWERVLGNIYTELKTENVINRIKGTAEHPRHMERVIPGSVFEGIITIKIFNGDSCENTFGLLIKGFDLLMNDYLGGSGSRGYGRVDIKIVDILWKSVEDLKGEISLCKNLTESSQKEYCNKINALVLENNGMQQSK